MPGYAAPRRRRWANKADPIQAKVPTADEARRVMANRGAPKPLKDKTK
jgi:hypothetical protein